MYFKIPSSGLAFGLCVVSLLSVPSAHSSCVVNGVDLGALDWDDARAVQAALRNVGTLATLTYPPSARESVPVSVDLGWREILELNRMLIGEVVPRSVRTIDAMAPNERADYLEEYWNHAALVVWTVVNRNFHVTGGDADRFSFLKFMRGFSQPINPNWRRTGMFCRRGSPNFGGPARDASACSEHLLSRRDGIYRRSWGQVPRMIRGLVLNFAAGRLPNPDPRVVDFAVHRRTMCDHPGSRLPRTRIIHRIWDHGFCGVAAPGIPVVVTPGEWARCLPDLPMRADPFEVSEESSVEASDSDADAEF